MEVLKKVFQFLFVIAVMPFVFAAIHHLPGHMVAYPTDVLKLFMAGGASFVAVYLFIYQCREIQAAGQHVIERIFGFSPVVQNIMTKVFSFYLFLAVLLFLIVSRVLGMTQYNPQMMFLIGFFFAMHNVLIAVQMQEQDDTRFFKVSYLSSFMTVLMVNIAILILIFDAIRMQFTFWHFAQKVVESGQNYILWVIERLPFVSK